MSHIRTQIRDAIAAKLRAIDDFNGHVFPNRREQLADDLLPAAVIRTPAEATENQADDSKLRTITVTVEILAGTGTTPDELDALCAAAERALDASDLNGLVTTVELVSTETEFTRDNATEYGSATLTFNAVCFTAIGDPETST